MDGEEGFFRSDAGLASEVPDELLDEVRKRGCELRRDVAGEGHLHAPVGCVPGHVLECAWDDGLTDPEDFKTALRRKGRTDGVFDEAIGKQAVDHELLG